MNQPRWTCLSALVFTTVIAPTATVHAKTLTVPLLGRDNQVPLSPRRALPIVLPSVTELETEGTVPTVTAVVPSVSQLPLVKPIAVAARTGDEGNKFFGQSEFPSAQPDSVRVSSTKFIPTKIGFNANFQAIDSSRSVSERVVPSVPPLEYSRDLPGRLSTPAPQPQASTSAFTTHKVGTPIPVVRNDLSRSAPIVNSATAEAEIDSLPQPVPRVTPITKWVATTTARPKTTQVPQPAPLVTPIDKRADSSSFEAAVPVPFIDNDRPHQIITTTIAQIGNETVAPELSIAIPVQRPQQSAMPTQSETPERSIVKIEQPTATVKPALDRIVTTQTGQASWYGSEAGVRTANGERYNPNGLTAAHRTLPFGTKVRVTSIKTGKSALVRINDRGPFHSSRMIDVSAGTAAAIGIKNDGIGEVRMEVLADEE